MRYVGLDVHKTVIEAAIVDTSGRVIGRERFAATTASICDFAERQLTPEDRVALEATTNTWAIATILDAFVHEVVVSNPMATRAIAYAKVKTDKIDAEVLAQLLRCGYLPHVWRPDPATIMLRQLCAQRSGLGHDRTRHKNRIRSLLAARLIAAPLNLFNEKGRSWMPSLDLDPSARRQLDREIEQAAHGDELVKLLMTLPGVDVAVAVLAALGDVARFKNAKKLASTFGLCPSTKQSADTRRHGKITKQGNGHARWMLVEAAKHVARNAGPLGVFLRRLRKKKSYNIAIVAVARELATIVGRSFGHKHESSLGTSKRLSPLASSSADGDRQSGSPSATIPPAIRPPNAPMPPRMARPRSRPRVSPIAHPASDPIAAPSTAPAPDTRSPNSTARTGFNRPQREPQAP